MPCLAGGGCGQPMKEVGEVHTLTENRPMGCGGAAAGGGAGGMKSGPEELPYHPRQLLVPPTHYTPSSQDCRAARLLKDL